MADGDFPVSQKRRGRPPGQQHRAQIQARQLAKQNSARAIARLAELIDHENPAVAITACREILDRAHGRPKPEQTPIEQEQETLGEQLQRALQRRQHRLMRLEQSPDTGGDRSPDDGIADADVIDVEPEG